MMGCNEFRLIMYCKASRKQLLPTTQVRVYLMGPMYSGKKFLSAQLASSPLKQGGLLFKSNCRVVTRRTHDRLLRFLLFEQAEEKYERVVSCIEEADIILVVYDVTDNEQMDYFTFWAEKLKEHARHSGIAFVGRRFDQVTTNRTSLKLEEILSREVLEQIRQSGWTHLEIPNGSPESLNTIWDFLVSRAPSRPANEAEPSGEVGTEVLVEKNSCAFF